MLTSVDQPKAPQEVFLQIRSRAQSFQLRSLAHFTIAWLVTWPMYGNEPGGTLFSYRRRCISHVKRGQTSNLAPTRSQVTWTHNCKTGFWKTNASVRCFQMWSEIFDTRLEDYERSFYLLLCAYKKTNNGFHHAPLPPRAQSTYVILSSLQFAFVRENKWDNGHWHGQAQ